MLTPETFNTDLTHLAAVSFPTVLKGLMLLKNSFDDVALSSFVRLK